MSVWPGWKRWVVAVSAGLAIGMVVGTIAVVAYQRTRDGAAEEALDAGQAAFGRMLDALSEAADVDGLHDAALVAGQVASDLDADADDLDLATDMDKAAAAVLAAQSDVAEAFSGLRDLNGSTLDGWATTSEDIEDGVEGLSSQVEQLAVVDEDAAADIADPDPVVDHVYGVVGQFASGAIVDLADNLLDELSQVRLTTDIQAVAAEAAAYSVAAGTAATGLDEDDSEARTLVDAGELLAAIAGLTAIDADNLDAWPQSRVAMNTTMARLPAVASAGAAAVANLNRLVSRARQKLANWRVAYQDAARKRRQDLTAFGHYESQVRSELRAYRAARTETSQVIDDLVAGRGADFDYFSHAAAQREWVRDALLYMSVPPPMQSAHDRLVDVVEDAVGVMRIAEQHGFDWIFWCEGSIYVPANCDFRDSESWRQFSAGSTRISTSLTAAIEAWEVARSSARQSIAKRKLPTRPQV